MEQPSPLVFEKQNFKTYDWLSVYKMRIPANLGDEELPFYCKKIEDEILRVAKKESNILGAIKYSSYFFNLQYSDELVEAAIDKHFAIARSGELGDLKAGIFIIDDSDPNDTYKTWLSQSEDIDLLCFST